MRISQSEGKQIGLKERLLGAMGTIRIPLTPFCSKGPPADKEYAVDPVGVDMRMPSPAVCVKCSPFTDISIEMRSCAFLEMKTSLMHTLTLSPGTLLLVFPTCSRIMLARLKGHFVLPRWKEAVFSSTASMEASGNLHMKPSDPLWKEMRGGTSFTNSLAAQRIVPSPPTVMMQSMIFSCRAILNSRETNSGCLLLILSRVLASLKQKFAVECLTNVSAALSINWKTYSSSQILPTISTAITSSFFIRNQKLQTNNNTKLLINMESQGRIDIDIHSIFHTHGEPEQEKGETVEEEELEYEGQEDMNDLEDTEDLSAGQMVVSYEVVMNYNKVSANTQLENLSRLIKSKQSTIKKRLIVDSSKITNKLYQKKHTVCSKGCKQPEKAEQKQKKEQQKGQQQILKDRKLKARGVHDRLYNMSKSQVLRQKYINLKPEKVQPQHSLSASKSSKYLQKYVPFQKRLEQHLSLGKLANSSCNKEMNTEQFRPKLIPNKYSQKVQARYNKNEIRELRSSDIAEFLNSSISSSLSSQSRSAAIMNKIEEHFITKNKQKQIQVSQDTISLLTEVEFEILQPFIMELEEKGIKGCDFQTKLRQFYESLRLGDRLQLRNHETKTRGKYRQMRQQARKKGKTPKKTIIEKLPNNYKKEDPKGNYHLTIQQFI